MIEKIVIQHLNSVQNVPVYAEVPTNPPKKFIVIEKTAGGINNHVCRSTIAVQSYDETMLGAAELNEELKGHMMTMVTLPDVSAVVLNSDYNYTDNESKRYRYQAVYNIVHF